MPPHSHASIALRVLLLEIAAQIGTYGRPVPRALVNPHAERASIVGAMSVVQVFSRILYVTRLSIAPVPVDNGSAS